MKSMRYTPETIAQLEVLEQQSIEKGNQLIDSLTSSYGLTEVAFDKLTLNEEEKKKILYTKEFLKRRDENIRCFTKEMSDGSVKIIVTPLKRERVVFSADIFWTDGTHSTNHDYSESELSSIIERVCQEKNAK